MVVTWIDDETFRVDLELIEPPPEYGVAEYEPLEFISGIETGTIPLIFTFQLTMKVESVGFVEVTRGRRDASVAERKAYLDQYRKFCSDGRAHSRRIFFVLPECMDIKNGVVVFKHEFFKNLKKGETNA